MSFSFDKSFQEKGMSRFFSLLFLSMTSPKGLFITQHNNTGECKKGLFSRNKYTVHNIILHFGTSINNCALLSSDMAMKEELLFCLQTWTYRPHTSKSMHISPHLTAQQLARAWFGMGTALHGAGMPCPNQLPQQRPEAEDTPAIVCLCFL